jgi:hypothetical protein
MPPQSAEPDSDHEAEEPHRAGLVSGECENAREGAERRCDEEHEPDERLAAARYRPPRTSRHLVE